MSPSVASFPLLLLLACADKVVDSEQGSADVAVADADGDGHAEDVDCDDANPAIHPDATEICDGIDNDCDARVDDADDGVDLGTGHSWYADADGDGYGVGALGSACDSPGAASRVDGDCDDGDAAIHPDATEICDGIDNDCDTWVDADDDSIDAALLTLSYPDGDGDGFGDASAGVTRCDLPPGNIRVGGDCDDTDPSLHPDTRWYADGDGDGWGVDGAFTTACLEPSGSARAVGDCDDGHDGVHPGATETCGNGIDDNCDGSASPCVLAGGYAFSAADAILSHADSGSAFGCDLVAADLDGDGQDDLVSGACDADSSPGVQTGQVYIRWGPILANLSMPADADLSLSGAADGDNAGVVSRAGDVDGDGYPDLLVGASDADDNGSGSGTVYLLLGPLGARSSSLDLASAADRTWTGASNADHLGTDAALGGDYDGDGLGDLLVGADSQDSGGSNAGAVYLISGALLGPAASGTAASAAHTTLRGVAAYDNLGDSRQIADAVDLDGDGLHDLVLGSPGNDDFEASAGAVWVHYGDAGGFASSLAASDLDACLQGSTTFDFFGEGVESIGDLDGDGHPDLGVGAVGFDGAAGPTTGALYVLGGGAARWSGTLSASALARARIEGAATLDGLGEGVAGADFDGDGLGDLVVGNDGSDAAYLNGGQVALFYGPVSGILSTTDAPVWIDGPVGAANFGRQLRTGDLNGDGYGDLLGSAEGATAIALFFGLGQ